MNPFDLLVTFAELAVSYIGFASIVAAIQSLGGREWAPVDKMLFRVLIEISIVGVFLSLIPVTLSTLEMNSDRLWVISSAIALLSSGAAMFVRSRQNRRYLKRQPTVGKFVALPLGFLSVTLSVLNLALWRTAPAYMIVMLIWLTIASAMFLALVFRFFPLSPGADTASGPDQDG